MKSFAMLSTSPIDPADKSESRYFIDGARVSADEFRKLRDNAERQDSFRTYRFGDRWHFSSVCYR